MQTLHALRLSTAPFPQYLMSVFDVTRDKRIDFTEFVAAMWALCCPSRTGLLHLAFDLYDFGVCVGETDMEGEWELVCICARARERGLEITATVLLCCSVLCVACLRVKPHD